MGSGEESLKDRQRLKSSDRQKLPSPHRRIGQDSVDVIPSVRLGGFEAAVFGQTFQTFLEISNIAFEIEAAVELLAEA